MYSKILLCRFETKNLSQMAGRRDVLLIDLLSTHFHADAHEGTFSLPPCLTLALSLSSIMYSPNYESFHKLKNRMSRQLQHPSEIT